MIKMYSVQLNRNSRRPNGHVELLLCILICVVNSLAFAGEAELHASDEKLISSGWDRFTAGDIVGAKKIAEEIAKTRFKDASNILLGAIYYQEKKYNSSIQTILQVYPIEFNKNITKNYSHWIDLQNRIAAATLGKAMYKLNRHNAQVMKYLLEGTLHQSYEGMHDIEALQDIANIYSEEVPELALAYLLEAYNLTTQITNKNLHIDSDTEQYLYDSMFSIAELYARMGFIEESTIWLKKAIKNLKRDYRKLAADNPAFALVLENMKSGE